MKKGAELAELSIPHSWICNITWSFFAFKVNSPIPSCSRICECVNMPLHVCSLENLHFRILLKRVPKRYSFKHVAHIKIYCNIMSHLDLPRDTVPCSRCCYREGPAWGTHHHSLLGCCDTQQSLHWRPEIPGRLTWQEVVLVPSHSGLCTLKRILELSSEVHWKPIQPIQD